MANRIKIRHGSGKPGTSQLLPYELGWDYTNKILYINNNDSITNIINSVSNTWAGGTTAGPTIKTIVNGVSGTAVAIPTASTTASGVVTTGAQTFTGVKTFTNPETINTTGNGAAFNFKFSNAATANTIYGQNWISYENTSGRFYWREWSGSSSGRTSYYEQYRLPACDASRTSNVTYNIITSKNPADLGYYLPLTGGTVTGTLVLSKTTDASGTANNSPALIIGGAATAAHIEIDNNEILAKSNDTTPSVLYLQDSSGTVSVAGTGGLTVPYGNLKVGNAHATSSSNHALWGRGITVSDTRYDTIGVTSLAYAANFFFSNNGMPNSNWWSGLHVAGWTGDYNAWELAGPSHNSDQRTQNLCIRVGRTSNGWGAWRALVTSSDTTSRSIFLTTSASVPSGAVAGDIVLVKV